MTITSAGSPVSTAGDGKSTLGITTAAVGNVVMLSIDAAVAVSGVSGGNCTGWTQAMTPHTATSVSGVIMNIWYGTVNATGAATITVTYASSVSNVYIGLDAHEFTAGTGPTTTWAVDTSGVLDSNSSTSFLYPALTPSTAYDELYFGHALCYNTAAAGTNTSASYYVTAAGDLAVWSDVKSATFQPDGDDSPAGPTSAIAVLLTSSASSSSGGTVTASATLSGTGTLGVSSTAPKVTAGAAGATLVGSGALFTVEAFDVVPYVPPTPPGLQPPTAAGLALYAELAQLTAGDADAGFPLRTFVDAAAGWLLQTIDNLVRDSDAGDPGWSQVIDPTRAPTSALPWLGQFVGVTVDTTTSDAAQRAQITGESGFGRGTPAAIQAAAQRYLANGQSATIIERDGDAYTLTVIVSGAQVTSRTYGELTAGYTTYASLQAAFPTYAAMQGGTSLVQQAVQAAVPAGINLNFYTQTSALLRGVGSFGARPS